MIKKLFCFILSAAMIFLLSGCGFNKGKDAALFYPIDSDPGYLDPQIISDPDAKNIIANCFEGLVCIDQNGTIIPGCAKSWEISPDGLTYTFHLRDNMRWAVMSASSDFLGEDFKKTFDFSITSEDFLFGLQRALMPETKSPGAKNLLSIKNAAEVNSGKLPPEDLGVTAIDDYTLTITLTMADPDFLYILLEPECMPCDKTFFEKTGGRYGLSTRFLAYNGPFYLSNWADDTGFTLYKNDDYYDYENVMPYSLYFSVNNEQETRLDKIKDETYTAAPLTASQFQSLSKSRRYTTISFDSGIYGLAFNCADTYLSNVNLRKAVALSLDKELLFSYLGQGNAQGILPPSMIISGENYRAGAGEISLESNEDSAALLEKALQELDIDDVELELLCTEEQQAAVRHILQVWQADLGVKLNISVAVATEEEITQKIIDGEQWQIALTGINFPGITAFNGLLQFTSDSTSNILGFSDKTYDKLVASIKTASGKQDTLKATAEAEHYLVSQYPLIPLYNYPTYYGLGKDVSGIVFNTTGDVIYLKNTLVK